MYELMVLTGNEVAKRNPMRAPKRNLERLEKYLLKGLIKELLKMA